MIRVAMASLVVLLTPVPAIAQVDPVGVGQGAVLSTTMRAHSTRSARQRGYRQRGATRSDSIATCGRVPQLREQYGAGDPRVLGLARACAKAGL